MIGEQPCVSESNFNRISNQVIDVMQGHYILLRSPDESDHFYDFNTKLSRITNPVTMTYLNVSYQDSTPFLSMHEYIVLDDNDYENLSIGLTKTWKENMVLFNVTNPDKTYTFSKRLLNSIIDHSSEISAYFDGYDFISKQVSNSIGEEYWADSSEYQNKIDYDKRESSDFYMYWRYMPSFTVVDKNDFIINLAVFLMLFIFISLICFAAVLVIGYTRCITIALNNKQVYDDLRRLGANRSYLYNAVKNQISKVFFIPSIIGSIVIYAFYTMIMYFNDYGLSKYEFVGLIVDVFLMSIMGCIIWIFYRITLKKTLKLCNI
jgi:hypothetical protein